MKNVQREGVAMWCGRACGRVHASAESRGRAPNHTLRRTYGRNTRKREASEGYKGAILRRLSLQRGPLPGVSDGAVMNVIRPPRKQSARSLTKKGGGAGGGSGGVGGGGGGNGCDGTHVRSGNSWKGGVASNPKDDRRSSGVWWL